MGDCSVKQIGNYRGCRIFRTEDGAIAVSHLPAGSYLQPEVTILSDAAAGDTLEGFIAALREACADPRERVVAAARAYAAKWPGAADCYELRAAVEALEHAECDAPTDEADEADEAYEADEADEADENPFDKTVAGLPVEHPSTGIITIDGYYFDEADLLKALRILRAG